MRKLALLAVLAAGAVFAPAAVASPTLRMTIVHLVQGCHVWGDALGDPTTPTRTITVKPGTKLQIRINCPMSFDFSQLSGPTLALGDPQTFPGTARTIVFKRAGVYKLRAVNVETSEQQGLQTLGPDNTLFLTVRVR